MYLSLSEREEHENNCPDNMRSCITAGNKLNINIRENIWGEGNIETESPKMREKTKYIYMDAYGVERGDVLARIVGASEVQETELSRTQAEQLFEHNVEEDLPI